MKPYEVEPHDDLEKIAKRVYEVYQSYLKGYNAVDFNDLINLTIDLYVEFPEVLDKYQERFRYIMVDEYQDTNFAQYKLTTLLASKYRNIAVVGDDDQSIYAFRGADVSNILSFENEYPDAKIVTLTRNYRSTKAILEAAHSVISNNTQRKDKKVVAEGEEGIPPTIMPCEDEREEAQLVAYKQSASADSNEYKLKHYSSNMVLREWVSGYYSAQLKDNNIKPENVYIGYRYSDDEDFTYNETTVSNNRYYGYGPKVASAKLDQTYQIAFFEKVGENEYQQISSIKYASVYSYLYTMLSKNENLNLNATQKAQLNMIKSVYYYGETSKEYFNLTNTEAINENN